MMQNILAAFFLLLFTAGAAAQTSTGSIVISGKQMGSPVTGEFKKFKTKIEMDSKSIALSRATVDVDMASIDIGLEDFNQELRSKTWFDAKNHPTATFTSTAISPLDANRVQVTGRLTIKGRTQDATLPVTLKTEGGVRVFEGVLPIRRTAFNIGEGEWKDTSIVADEVQVRFRIPAPVPAK